jgi:signal transduction histidine kinase/CheY-like chemotaxis protein
MKLNYRFILITFLIVLIISISSTFVFYSLAGNLISKQQSKTILNATTDFAFAFQSELQKTEEDFQIIKPQINNFKSIKLDSLSIDFCFTLVNDSLINAQELKTKSKSYLNIRSSSFHQFFSNNPNVILRYSQVSNGKTVYYGSLISSSFLSRLSQKIRSEVALVINDSPVEVSNPEKNQAHLLGLINAWRQLKYRNSYDLYLDESENADFVAGLFVPKFILTPGAKINFMVFDLFKEGVEFRNTLKLVMILIVFAGSVLTFVIVWVSTAKLRKQFFLLSEAAEITGKGDLDHRVEIITHDEAGKFGEAFNKMLDELERNKKTEKEYAEFITLINQNPTLKEVSDAALSKIIKSTGLTFGVLYIVERKTLRLISSFGVNKDFIEPTQSAKFYSNAIEKKEKIEFHFNDNFPEIKTGIAVIKIKYLMIFPILYNRETIAILELASESKPQPYILNYIDNIHEQLAVGLANAKSFEQLENFVSELKKLNEEYQKQNEQIVQQNEELKELHKQLREKAIELERQRQNAIELTKVKSEFLASMSHELRTPLISILGLTELLIKESGVNVRTKDRLNIVHRNGKKLLTLINNILEFSKFESGKIEIKKESFLLNDLLEEMNPNIQQLTLDKNLNYVLNIPSNTNILINTDKGKLEQILLNLLINAVKFTDKGSIQLNINVVEGTSIEFQVIDTGIGISDEHKKLIFSEFQQVDGSTSRKYGGAGLGLAICKRYVELLGGMLSLQSEVGKGSRFSFLLNDIVLDVVENDGHQFLTVSETEKKMEALPKALIINDNHDSQKLIGDYLASYHYDIILTEKSEDGLRLAKENSPQIIILDPFIHDGNVWSMILELRKVDSTSDIPLVLTMMIEEEKVGWEPEIFDFVIGVITNSKLKSIISNIEKHFNNNVDRIVILDKNKSEFELLNKSFGEKYKLESITSLKSATETILKVNPQIIIVDISSFSENALQLCYELSQNRVAKNIPVILKLPSEFDSEQIDLLNNKLKELTLKIKSHPLDVLKILRDRLKIDSSGINNSINMIEQTVEVVQSENSIKKIERHNDSKPTILIVDDDNDALFTIGEFVKEMNCNTIFAHNGMECLLTLNHVEPDLIFLDIMMPQMDGFETIKRIRLEKRFAQLPVIALTAYAMLDNKNVIEKNGFNDIVTKPINSQTLSSALKKYLHQI